MGTGKRLFVMREREGRERDREIETETQGEIMFEPAACPSSSLRLSDGWIALCLHSKGRVGIAILWALGRPKQQNSGKLSRSLLLAVLEVTQMQAVVHRQEAFG